MPDVGMVGVVPPGDGELAGAEGAGDPEDEQVAAVPAHPVHGPLPGRQVVGRHAHEGDVVATMPERARPPGPGSGADPEETGQDQHYPFAAHATLSWNA